MFEVDKYREQLVIALLKDDDEEIIRWDVSIEEIISNTEH
jgi:hypothetical protein